MKKNLLILFYGLVSLLSSHAQGEQVTYKTVSLYAEQTFYLNGGMRALAGGKSRSTYKIELPPNTVEWYYSITVERNQSKNLETLNLLSQLTGLIDQTGLSTIATSSLLTPTGSGVCDAFLLAGSSVQNFLAKQAFNYDLDHSRTNYKNGTVKIIMKPGYISNFYICFRNPSASEGVTVRFSAVAVIAEKQANYTSSLAPPSATVENQKVWTKDDKNRIYNYLEKGIRHYYDATENATYSESDIKDIAAYLADAIIATNKEYFLELAAYEAERLFDRIIGNCPKCVGLPSYIFAKTIER